MLKAMFSRFLVSFRTELRLLTLNWLYPLLHVLWGALFFQLFIGKDNRSAQALLETTVGRLTIGLISLIGLFMAGVSISRSKRFQFQEIEETYPTGFEVIGGRWMAVFVTLILFLIEPLVIAAYQGPLTSWVEGVSVFLFDAGLTIAFVNALAWMLLLRRNIDRWGYLILAAVWLAFLLGPSMLSSHFPPASLLNFMRQGVSFYSDVWGRLIYGTQPIWFNLFYFGLFLFCLAGMMQIVSVRRFHSTSKIAIGLIVIASILAGWGGTRYVGGFQKASFQNRNELTLNEPVHVRITGYQVVMDLANPRIPHFHVVLEVLNLWENNLEQFTLRLNPVFSVTRSNVEVKHDGDWIDLHLSRPLAPGESTLVILEYEGALRVENISDGVVETTDFIDPQGIRLTTGVAWYPLAVSNGQLADHHEPARFSLHIENNPGLPVAANIPAVGENHFAAEQVSWVFLVASPRLVVEQIDDVTLITASADLQPGREMAVDYSRALRAIVPFFPNANVKGLILMVLGEEGGLPAYTPPAEGYPVIVTQRYVKTPNTWQSFITRTIASDLWFMIGGRLEDTYNRPVTSLDQAFEAVVGFLNLYRTEQGNAEKMLTRFQNINESGMVVNENLQALLEIYQQGGEPAIATIVWEMTRKSAELEELPYDALPAWIRSIGTIR
ncbi:hypothetical protein ATHL_01207 [Anaerolinea thermolimosa]|uniref:hypothetical protein n=1 Tax=Anaerolinea thermolimosa TaxID=229919 RepID=UPI000784925B|nr:hypothetical protein [Anaerolinea thermolimosa]GAP06353.1 hypothetical protein ATHL_01207 [Anaerolinea thermolimosa]